MSENTLFSKKITLLKICKFNELSWKLYEIFHTSVPTKVKMLILIQGLPPNCYKKMKKKRNNLGDKKSKNVTIRGVTISVPISVPLQLHLSGTKWVASYGK